MSDNEKLDNVERFKKVFAEKITRAGSEDLLEWIENTDFFTAPASSKYHGAYEGGLVEHSLDVYDEINRLLVAFPEMKVSEETLAIVALLHDVCKANYYKTEYRNAKDENGNWIKVPFYTVDEQLPYGGHGDKFVYVIMCNMMLTDEEAVAIRNHMGNDDGKYTCAKPFEKYPLAFLLHLADESATWYLHRV